MTIVEREQRLSSLASARLCVVTAAGHGAGRVLETVRAACDAGASVVQLRRKGDDGLEQLRLAQRCLAVTSAAGVLLIINDRLDVAMAVGADGVHLGQDDLPPALACRLWPSGLIGRSTHTLAQAVAAQAEGADYAGVGPIHATPTKPGRPAVGLELVRAVAAARLGIPWFAIGGIDRSSAPAVLDAGATRIAVVRAVAEAADPAAAVRELSSVLDAGRTAGVSR